MSSETNSPINIASDYGSGLLRDLGAPADLRGISDHPALAFRRSGLLDVTGRMLPIPLLSHIDGAMMALKSLSDRPELLPNNGSQLLGERSRMGGDVVSDRWSANAYCKLLDCRGGRLALNLSRRDDWNLLTAWLEEDVKENWDDIGQKVRNRDLVELVERGAEIGLPMAKDEMPPMPSTWFNCQSYEAEKIMQPPIVVDLSSLWAGPLASNLLQLLGCRVIKVEGPNRPDGAREGDKAFYSRVNGGKEAIALNFRDPDDLKTLKQLLAHADIVIEASRPRAFQQLGIVAEDFVARKPGQVWARLTAYGRDQNRIGFGDDIGIAAGLSQVIEKAHGTPGFVGDAIADPVNGVHMALAIWAKHIQGGGCVLDFAMRDVLRYAMGDIPETFPLLEYWESLATADQAPLYPLREPAGKTAALGEHTDQIRAELC